MTNNPWGGLRVVIPDEMDYGEYGYIEEYRFTNAPPRDGLLFAWGIALSISFQILVSFKILILGPFRAH